MALTSKTTFYYLVLSIFFFIFAVNANNKLHLPALQVSKQETATNLRADFAKIFSFGQKRLLSSLLWSQTLLGADIDHYKTRDLNSWLFLRFKTIIALEPEFYMSYLVGGQYLSIIKDDLDGASYLYRKAMEKYPNDYSINYHAGFHFLYEAKDLTQAKIAYTRLSTVPDIQKKFPLLPKILARIDADSSGDDENALKILTQAYLELPDKHPLKNAYLKAIKKRGGQIPLNNH